MGWYKDHRADAELQVTASAYQGDDGRIRATVFAHGADPDRVQSDVICDSYEIAKVRAEEELMLAYPHDCGSGCGTWKEGARRGLDLLSAILQASRRREAERAGKDRSR